MNPGKLGLIFCALILTNAAAAATFEEEHASAVAKNPPDVVLHLRFKDGKNVFRQGECIRLEVIPSFRSEVHKIYDLEDFHYPGIGWIDHIKTDRPADVTDPLADYLLVRPNASRFAGPLGEALSENTPKLLYVNGWCRFIKPGKYRVYLTTNRLTEHSKRHLLSREKLQIASETIDLEITPRDAAQDSQDFDKALTILNRPLGMERGGYVSWERARMAMQFLETPQAISYLIHRLGREEFETANSLYTLPNPRTVLPQLEHELYTPDHPIGLPFIEALANFSLMSERSGGRAGHDAAWSRWMTKLSDAVWAKEDAARATSIMTLLWWESNWQRLGKPKPGNRVTAQTSKLKNEAIRLFDQLSDRDQTALLVSEILPAVTRMELSRTIYATARQLGKRTRHVETAVHQLLQLSPEEGKKIILDEQKNPAPVLSARFLRRSKPKI